MKPLKPVEPIEQSGAVAELKRESDRLRRAEEIIGHVFGDRSRLLSALTHRSYLNERTTGVAHNEVLELLGDAVLSLVVVVELVNDSPGVGEGPLTERRAAHVSAENLTKASTSSGLQSLLRTGNGLRNDGAIVDNLAADVVEAVIGAVYTDAGLEAARRVVLKLLGPPPRTVVAAAVNAKRILQERLQRVFGKAPEYSVNRKDGPNHAPVYGAIASFAGKALGHGVGKNKRLATEEAAAAAVAALAHLDDDGLRAHLS